jgi:aspartate aminotransferase
VAKVLEKHPHVYVVADEIYEHNVSRELFCSIIYPGMLEEPLPLMGAKALP